MHELTSLRPFSQDSDDMMLTDAKSLLQELSKPSGNKVPTGRWRDGLFDIFRHGYWHGSAWTALSCTPIATTQVIGRMYLTQWGTSNAVMGQQQRRSAIFQTVCLTVLSYWVVRALLFLLIAILDPNTFLHHSAEFIKPGKAYYLFCLLDDALSYTYLLICAIQLRNVRSAIRKAYKIPASFVGEDTCYSLACPCLVAAQTLRHTTDYETQPSRWCCSETGLPVTAPVIV
jgi:hypothetical protein